MSAALFVLGVAACQNASFTLVSRARNSNSLVYHAWTVVLSNGLWLVMFRKLSTNLDSGWVMAAYMVGSVSGSLLMHHVAMRFLEVRRG